MRKQFQWMLLSMVAISVLFSASLSWGETKEDVDAKIRSVQNQLNQKIQQQNNVMGKLTTTQRQLNAISSNLDRLTNRLGDTQRNMDNINHQLDQAQQQLDQIKANIAGRRGLLNQRIVAIYKMGYQNYFEILFNSKDFGEFISRFEMVGDFVRSDIALIKILQQQQEQITQKHEEIAQKQQELATQKEAYSRLHNQTKMEQSRWLSTAEQQKRQLADIQSDRNALENAMDELEKTSKEMESKIQNYQNQNHNSAVGTGHFIWPVKGPITSPFGWRFHPILRRNLLHTGIDIGVPMYTPIVAADSGTVIFSGLNGGYGNMVAIDHGASFSTLYAHQSVLLVHVGQTVAKGQLIGKVGTTGWSTGPHLHFEIRKNGVPVDPMGYL